MKKTELSIGLCASILAAFGMPSSDAQAQLPPDFPAITTQTYNSNALGTGYVFIASMPVSKGNKGLPYYLLILNNDGSPHAYKKVWYKVPGDFYENDFKVLPNGLLHYSQFFGFYSYTGGGTVEHVILDENLNELGPRVQMGNGYVADAHDFEMLPNGHMILMGYYTTLTDLSQVVPGAYPRAEISGGIIQELDADQNVVWQWRAWDHFSLSDYPYWDAGSTAAASAGWHVNVARLDPKDGNLFVTTTEEVMKINRQTGDVMWRLGGGRNQFTFVGVDPADGLLQLGGHDFHRLPTGNVIIYDGGTADETQTSRVHEYQLDETNKIATHIWSYVATEMIPNWARGSAQRLPNGNTFIGWGTCSDTNINPPDCTEVMPDGTKVWEMWFNDPLLNSYRAFREVYPPSVQRIQAQHRELASGNTYNFTNTGVIIDITDRTGDGYNTMTVYREPYSPVSPSFLSKAPMLLPVRVNVSQTAIDSITGLISFDVGVFGVTDPTNTIVYYRQTPGQGIFVPLQTDYNWVTYRLTAPMNGFGEFALGFPDIVEVPFPPLLIEPESLQSTGFVTRVPPVVVASRVYTVNQALPVALTWTPKGFAASYALQVSTNASFTNADVDLPFLTEARYTFTNAQPGTTYFWRVNTSNDGGVSDWATNSFTTVPPAIQVTSPNGGEAWRRGLPYFVQWNDNLNENVRIDLYKGGSLVRNLTTNTPSTVAFKWSIPVSLTPGSDYTVQITSVSNSALSSTSAQSFSIVDSMAVSVATVPTGLTVTVDGTNYTTPANFNWLSASSHTLVAPSPQAAGDGHSRNVFTAWSDGGAQTNVITVPFVATSYTATYSTQYLLDVTTTPTGGGTVSNNPAGPWYDAGQLVSLTARTNSGYRIYFWQGADSAVTNTAQVTMNGYRLVQANFIPSDYPYLVVTNRGEVAPGSLIGSIAGRTADGTRTYYVVLDNTGTNALFSSKTNTLSRFVTPQGFDAVPGGGSFSIKDETVNAVGSFTTLGYTLDTHDIDLLPNGHALVFAQEFRTFDLSQVVPNGRPNANITGNVIQEIDANKRLVFEWHTFDHIAITNTFADMTQANFDYAHINAVSIDPTDNNLLASLRTTSEIVKINRRTGEIMWRLGGKMNQFTFIGEHPENAPYYTVGQHDIHRLANGNLLYFDNGNISGGGITPNDRTYSRGVEYQLDEVNMTATLVWEFRHTPDISAPCTGSLRRFANGNTLINWGCAVATSGTIVTEVSPAGVVVFEMSHQVKGPSADLGKQVWNSPDLIRSNSYQGVVSGQAYNSSQAGVSVTVNNLTGPADNLLVVQRHLDAVRFPLFSGKAPQVVMEHIVLSGSNITTLNAELDLNLPDTSYAFDTPVIRDPAQVVVYQRATPGQGQFSALPTTYDAGTQKLRATTTQLGEFIFGYPDLAETPYVPAIFSPADQSQVNQAAPIPLAWTPQGLVGSFDLQVATDPAFANLVLDTNGLGSSSFSLQNPLPNTQYFWHVRVVNQGGTSDWASASFTTVPPVLHLTYPAGGEVWQRFQVVTFRWIDNISENVALDLYLDGVSNRTFVASTPSSGSYTWTVGQFAALPQSTNYTIKIRSTINPALFDFSQPFSIISNLTSVTIATVPTNLTVTVDGTNYTAPAVFNWLPSSSRSIDTVSPQVAGDGHSRSVFVAWSDGGAQSHSITVPFSPVTNTATFFTNYLLDITTTPAEAGTVSANPTGPWYDAGQLVSLTANTNAGYLFYTWQGVDNQTNNTAQLTMNGYNAVQAKFMPVSGVPLINAASLVRLPDGRVQFNLTAGAGVATQATLWGTTTLSPPDWRILDTVPLTGGSGVFIDDTAPSTPIRFYRVSLP